MAGHNKWSKIKHKKAVSDAQKSKEFSKLVKIIKVEARAAGGDTSSPGLKAAVDRARAANMPKENIERAIRGASGDASFESVTYEAYGPGGVAMIIEGSTDNKNRTSAEIKHLLSKKGLSVSQPGSSLWAFEKTNDGWAPKTTTKISKEENAALGVLLSELEDHDDVQGIYTNAE